MNQQIKQQAMGDTRDTSKIDLLNIPIACQYGNLCSNDTHRIHNEHNRWLKECSDKLPLWSRLKSTNCVGHPRPMMFSKNTNYEIEIPGRLLSIFGTDSLQTKLMNTKISEGNHYLVSNILSLCAVLRYNFKEWSANLLDNIVMQAVHIYAEILKQLEVNDKMFTIHHLNQLYQFEGADYKVQLQQVATGYLYIRYGLDKFNLARALTWFFHNYQFGLIKCCNRTLAFGCTLDTDYSFFMYDCQSRGFPLFQNQQTNSYILRTHHLQILLYCLIMTLNVSAEMIEFVLYNVDIRILNPLEIKTLKKEIYVPTIVSATKKVVEKKVDCGLVQKNIKVNPGIIKTNNKNVKAANISNIKNNKTTNNAPNNTMNKASKNTKTLNPTTKKPLNSSTSLTTKCLKNPITMNKTHTSKSQTLKIQDKQSSKEILLDPNKVYYIISVPKQTIKPTGSTKPKEPKTENPINNIKVNIHHFNTLNSQNARLTGNNNFAERNTESRTISLNKSDSTVTLTPDSIDADSTKQLDNLNLTINLANNSSNSVPQQLNNQNKIRVSNQLSDLLTK